MGKMTVYLGKDLITKIYDLADVYHSDNIDRVSDDFILAAKLQNVILIMYLLQNMLFQATGILEKSTNA